MLNATVNASVVPFGVDEEFVSGFNARQESRKIRNSPVRPAGVSFLDALLTDEADFIKHGLVSQEDWDGFVREGV